MPSNPNRRLKLTTSTQTYYDVNLTQSYKLIIDASNGNLMPNEIFLFLHVDPVPGYPQGLETFKGICNPAQLSNLPIDEPEENSSNKFYRSSHLELIMLTEAEATQAWTEILDAISSLKRALDFSDGLTSTTYWIGTAE